MQCFQKVLAYFTKVVGYARKMFMTLTPSLVSASNAATITAMTLGIMTLSIVKLNMMALSIDGTWHNGTQCNYKKLHSVYTTLGITAFSITV
jgi:hypothetical protein